MQDQKKAIVFTILGFLFIASTLYLNFFSDNHYKKEQSSDLLSVFSSSNSASTGLSDIQEGETVPNWKKAVLAQANIDDPSGAISQSAGADQKNLNDANNITAQYAKDVYTATAVVSQNTTLTQAQKKQLAEAILEQEALKAAAKSYTIKDIITVDDSTVNIKQYGNYTGAAVALSLQKVVKYDDLEIVKKYGTSNNEKDLAPLNEKVDAITVLRNNLLIAPVPLSAILYHLNLLNSVEMYLQTLINLKGIQTDPLRASMGISDYGSVYQGFFVAIDTLKEYFSFKNITFTAKEPGYLVSKGIIQ